MRLHFFTLMSAAIGLFLCCPTSALADDSSSALHKAGLSKEMAAALSKKDPEFVLFTLEAFSPSIQAKFKPTKRNPSPALVMGDFDGDGHQDAIVFGYNKRQIRLIVVNYGEGRELYSPKPGTGYHAVNWISWSGQPTTKPLTEYLASTTRKEALKQFGTENCDVEDVRKNREVLFTKYSETYTNAYAVNENMPIAFCKSNHKP